MVKSLPKKYLKSLMYHSNLIRVASYSPFIYKIASIRHFLFKYENFDSFRTVLLGNCKYLEFHMKKHVNVKNFMNVIVSGNEVSLGSKLRELNSGKRIWVCGNKNFEKKKIIIKNKNREKKNQKKKNPKKNNPKNTSVTLKSPVTTGIGGLDTFLQINKSVVGDKIEFTDYIKFKYIGENKKLEDIIHRKFKFYKSLNTIPTSNEFKRVLLGNCDCGEDLLFFKNNYEKIVNKIRRLNNESRKSLLDITTYNCNKLQVDKLLKKLLSYEKTSDENFDQIQSKFKKINRDFKKNFPKIPNFLALTKFNGKAECFLKEFRDLQNQEQYQKYYNMQDLDQTELKYLKKKYFFLYYNQEILLNIDLKEYHHLYIDGTRDICDIAGVQLVTITIKKEGYAGKQIIFCLTNKYDTETYEEILKQTSFFFHKARHLIVHADYEFAIHKATLRHFDKIIPCYFHFTKIITDNLKYFLKNKKVSSYDKISNLLRLVYFCPVRNLEILLEYIKSKCENEAHENIVSHIRNNFYGNGRFSKFVGYEYNNEMTNNTAEWFHMYLKGLITHKGTWNLIQTIELCLKVGYYRDLEKKKKEVEKITVPLETVANLLNNGDYSSYSISDFESLLCSHIPLDSNLNTRTKKYIFKF